MARLKNLLCIGERDTASFGQRKNSPLARKKRVAELVLELPDLDRKRRLRYVQALRRPREIAVLGHGPEIQQMMVVETRH